MVSYLSKNHFIVTFRLLVISIFFFFFLILYSRSFQAWAYIYITAYVFNVCLASSTHEKLFSLLLHLYFLSYYKLIVVVALKPTAIIAIDHQERILLPLQLGRASALAAACFFVVLTCVRGGGSGRSCHFPFSQDPINHAFRPCYVCKLSPYLVQKKTKLFKFNVTSNLAAHA